MPVDPELFPLPLLPEAPIATIVPKSFTATLSPNKSFGAEPFLSIPF